MRVKILMKDYRKIDILDAVECDKRKHITNVFTVNNRYTFTECTEDILTIKVDGEAI